MYWETLEFIMEQEGFIEKARVPVKGGGDVLTIGFGRTRNVKKGDVTTKEAELPKLKKDIAIADKAVRRLVKIPLTPNQLTALTSLVFNVGEGGFKNSEALKALNLEKFRFEVADPVKGFVRARKGGVVIKGLVNRRKREMDLFFNG